MARDKGPSQHRKSLQQRVLGAAIELPENHKKLHSELRKILLDAYDDELLKTPPAGIHRMLKRDRAAESNHYVIVGGEKNFRRDKSLSHFERDDGAWFDFAITVAQPGRRAMELIGYNFELRFEREGGPRFIRFDLNEPSHPNEDRDIRAHVHPGDDDLQVPSPLMSPSEVLQILLHDLRPPPKPRSKGREPKNSQG